MQHDDDCGETGGRCGSCGECLEHGQSCVSDQTQFVDCDTSCSECNEDPVNDSVFPSDCKVHSGFLQEFLSLHTVSSAFRVRHGPPEGGRGAWSDHLSHS